MIKCARCGKPNPNQLFSKVFKTWAIVRAQLFFILNLVWFCPSAWYRAILL